MDDLPELPNDENISSDLDGLALVPMSLEAQFRLASSGAAGSVPISVLRGRVESIGNRKRLFAPFSARNLLGIPSQSTRILATCSAVNYLGGFATTDGTRLSKVPMQRMPKRISPIYFDQLPDFDEIEFADAIELQLMTCPDARGGRQTPLGAPIWPIDLPDMGKLRKKIAALRELSHHQLPVGVAIPKGTVNVDVALIAKADVDFISIVDRSSFGKTKTPQAFEVSDLWVAVSARRAAQAVGHPELPIFLDTPIRNGYDVVKLAALGISGVILDRFMAPYLDRIEAEERPSGDRFLGDITSQLEGTRGTRVLSRLVRRLSQISREACEALTLCGYSSLHALQPHILIATNDKAQRLTSIPMV